MLVAVLTAVGGPWEMRNGPECLYEALDFVAKDKVRVTTETYKLDEHPKAYQRVCRGQSPLPSGSHHVIRACAQNGELE